MVAGADPLMRFPGVRRQVSSLAPPPSQEQDPGSRPATTFGRRRRVVWADLLQRVFEVDALRCPACGGRMRILSAITEPDVARRILDWLDMPSRAPPLAEPKGEPGEISREESTPDPPWEDDPGFGFDQSPPQES